MWANNHTSHAGMPDSLILPSSTTAAHLLGRRAHAGYRLSVAHHVRKVTDDRHFRMTGQRQVRVDHDTSGAVQRRVQCCTKRGCSDAGGPHHGARLDFRGAAVFGYCHATFGDSGNTGAGANLDAQFFELQTRPLGQFARKRR